MNSPGRTPTPADESSTAPCNDRPASLHGHKPQCQYNLSAAQHHTAGPDMNFTIAYTPNKAPQHQSFLTKLPESPWVQFLWLAYDRSHHSSCTQHGRSACTNYCSRQHTYLHKNAICSAISFGGIRRACPSLPINSARCASFRWFNELAWNMGVSIAPGAIQNTSTPAQKPQ